MSDGFMLNTTFDVNNLYANVQIQLIIVALQFYLLSKNKSKIITLCLSMKNVIKTENDTVLGFCVEQLYVF